MNYTQLAQLISGSAYAGMTAAQILAAVNTQSGSPGAIPTSEVLIWAASTGVRATLQTVSQSSGPLQSAALAALDMFQGNQPVFDLSNAAIQQMIQGFVSGGIVTTAQAAELNDLGLPPSPAMVALGRAATVADITQAQLMQQVLALRAQAITAQNAVFATLNAAIAQINAGATPTLPTAAQLGSTYTGAI